MCVRLPFLNRLFTDWDGPQFAIAIERFAPREHFPAPPGHFLYVVAARFTNLFFHNPHTAMISLSVIASGLNCAALFLIGKRIFSSRAGILASLIYLASPLFWFCGITYMLYPVNGFFALVAGYFLFEAIYEGRRECLIPASLFYGIMIGIRPQEVLFIFPLWLWAVWVSRFKYKAASLAVLALVCLAWFIPLAAACGGLRGYFNIIADTLSGGSRFGESVFHIRGLLKANIKYQLKSLFIAFGAGAIVFLYYLPQFFSIKNIASDKKTRIFIVWIVPVWLFWLGLNFNSAGYAVVAFLPMVLLLAEFLDCLAVELSGGRRNLLLACIIFLIAVPNLVYYFYDFNPRARPSALSFVRYPELKKREAYLAQKIDSISHNFNPEDTVVITNADDFMPAMYYLPQYRVYLIPDIRKMRFKAVFYAYRHHREKFYDLSVADIFGRGQVTKAALFEGGMLTESAIKK
jgi:4-amino-4-deoxy-L-arabinose transferase-like glycosyltransferase